MRIKFWQGGACGTELVLFHNVRATKGPIDLTFLMIKSKAAHLRHSPTLRVGIQNTWKALSGNVAFHFRDLQQLSVCCTVESKFRLT